jgi:hypothetical protein
MTLSLLKVDDELGAALDIGEETPDEDELVVTAVLVV